MRFGTGQAANDRGRLGCHYRRCQRSIPDRDGFKIFQRETWPGPSQDLLDQYKANKATNANGGLKWLQKGGGYYSQCVKKLKGEA